MGPSDESLALADALIAQFGLTADRIQLAYAIMRHVEVEFADDQPSPAGQGDALWPEIDMTLADTYSAGAEGLQFEGIARRTAVRAAVSALAARQPVGQEPVIEWRRYALPGGNWHDVPVKVPPPAQAVDLSYSLDSDPAGIRARVADVITGTLMVGAQGHTPPPAGHWAEPFWHAARADDGLQAKMREALWAAARSLRTIADSTKETEFLETAGEIRAYAGSRANCAEQALTDSRGVKLG